MPGVRGAGRTEGALLALEGSEGERRRGEQRGPWGRAAAERQEERWEREEDDAEEGRRTVRGARR